MGLQISEIVQKKEISFDQLKGKKIAVDSSQMLYQFLTSIRQRDGTPLMDDKGNITSHLVGIFSRISNLITRDIKLCFVFDGKPPILKVHEQEQREHRKRLAEEKLKKAVEEEDTDMMYRYSKQTVRLTKQMAEEAKELISALGLPVIQAPSEAEAQASFMCKNNDVWAVASSDFDSLLYGAPRIIQSLTLSSTKRIPSGKTIKVVPTMIELKDVLNTLELDEKQLLALAILVGTDYNHGGVKGIGPKKALKLVKEKKTFNKIFDSIETDFDYKEIKQVFEKMPVEKKYNLEWKKIDEEKIKEILIDKHNFSEDRVENTLFKLREAEGAIKQKGLSDFF